MRERNNIPVVVILALLCLMSVWHTTVEEYEVTYSQPTMLMAKPIDPDEPVHSWSVSYEIGSSSTSVSGMASSTTTTTTLPPELLNPVVV